ncbi:MAG: iron-sulfur cluster assembly scaffold protein [Pelagibacteraceae bacterium]
MIDHKVIKLASERKYFGLKKTYTHYSKVKNVKCGDIIEVELKVISNKIMSFHYETNGCVYCQASANILANKIRLTTIEDLNRDIDLIQLWLKNNKLSFPNKFKTLIILFKKENNGRFECIMLPIKAVLKALKTPT